MNENGTKKERLKIERNKMRERQLPCVISVDIRVPPTRRGVSQREREREIDRQREKEKREREKESERQSERERERVICIYTRKKDRESQGNIEKEKK